MSVIAAIATPLATGGIGIIRISGKGAMAVADKVFFTNSGKKVSEMRGYTAALGKIFDGSEMIDEALALVFTRPKSYTGEDVVELSCHGGIYVLQRVLRLVLQSGARTADPGEFTKRAYLNGKLDLAKAESVMELISAQGEQALKLAINTKQGALSQKIKDISSRLISHAAELAVWADYPDEDVPAVESGSLKSSLYLIKEELKQLIFSFDAGKAIREGIGTAICGRPNVGKSTLMNLLSGEEKSIVTDIAGTTRDIVEETVRLQNIVLHLYDTAGLRDSQDVVEQIGVQKARECMDRADLILAVFDNSEKLDKQDYELIDYCKNKKAIAIINKLDLSSKLNINEIKEHIPNVIEISASFGEGKKELEKEISKLMGIDNIDTSAAVLANERQFASCLEALAGVNEAILALESKMTLDAVNVSIDYAVDSLLSLTGEKATEAVVNEVFSNFCVGK